MKAKIYLLFIIVFSLNMNAQIKTGIRISFLTNNFTTEEQEQFVNSHYDYVMTPVLSDEMRAKYDSVEILLYRSIRGTWDDNLQFDWNFITQNENMFCHWDSLIQDTSTRIKTKYYSYLMDGGDIVDSTDPNAMNHWINYYAVTASRQVDSCNYDGLFMDSAGHKLNKDELADTTQMPWDYSDSTWRDDRYVALSFVKSYLPDKTVIFNGLHSGNGADSSLHLTDGAMWEDFAYNCDSGDYKGVGAWWAAITSMQENRDIAKLILTVKKPGLIDNDTARTFSVASYLLIQNENTVLTLSDFSLSSYIQYYPEFQIDLGEPTGDYYTTPDSLFVREFSDGLVIVNPFSDATKTYDLSQTYYKIQGVGGGIIDSLGNYDGFLSYDSVAGTLTLPPVSAYILKDSLSAQIFVAENNFEIITYPNPFDNQLIIEFDVPSETFATIKITDISGKEVARPLNAQKMSSGKHILQWEANNLVSGVYYCTLITESGKSTRKIIKK